VKKRLISGIKWTILYALITFALLEGILWIMGYRPYFNQDYHVSANPDNPYVADSKLGIRLNPGTFLLTLNKHVDFTATHQKNGQRLIPESPDQHDKSIVFLGCSFTYGYGVNDSESFPAVVQSKRPNWKIENHAVVGYGTAQHLIQLRKRLQENPPECVILCLSSVHFKRTVLSQKYRANLRIGYRRSSSDVDNSMEGARFPFFDNCNGEVKYATWENLYSELPGRYWFASVNFLQGILERNRDSNCDAVSITACLIQEMQKICSEKNIAFGVVCLDSSHETSELQQKCAAIDWKNIGFSFKKKKYTHLPYDSHPNKKGHQKIAFSVLPFIDKLLSDEAR